LYGFGNVLEAAADKAEYQNKLSSYLIELSCQDQWIATGIINNRATNDSFGSNLLQCLLELKDQKNQSDQLVCPALSKNDENMVKELKGRASRYHSELPFKCKTELSDPPSDSKKSF